MKVRPVSYYPNLGYPTRLEILDDPDLLLSNQPAGWKKVPGIATALACFLTAEGTLLTSCNGSTAKDATRTTGNIVIAPLFAHGEGRGALGCVAVNPPVFLSEDEAFTVIEQELAKHGVKLSKPTEGWEQVRVDKACSELCMGGPYRMLPDGEDQAKGIAVEFISQTDHYSLKGFPATTGQVFDFVDAAEHLRTQLIADSSVPRTHLGVLYEPMTLMSSDRENCPPGPSQQECWQTIRDRALDQSREDLREQVADFAAWLKGQGVL